MEPADTAVISQLEDLPIDLASEIFGHLTSSADLLHIAQASKPLFRLAIRLLYREICYDTLTHFYHNLPFWQRTNEGLENIAEVPRSVIVGRELGQGLLQDPHKDAVANFGYRFHGHGGQTNERFWPAFNILYDLLLSFTKLQSISFQQARFPVELYKLLGELSPSIRSLSFKHCSFVSTSAPASVLAPAVLAPLPITELNLTGNFLHAGRFPTAQPDIPTLPPMFQSALLDAEEQYHRLDMYQVLTRSPNIRALCLDWNNATAGRFSRDEYLPTPAFASLKHLEIRSWNRNETAWNSETNSPATKALLKSALYKLLAPCNRLTELVIFGYIPGVTPSGKASPPLLPALSSFTGPADFLKSTLRGCMMLQKIVFPDTIKDVDALMSNTLPHTASTNVRHFDVTLEKWDIEIMYAVIAELSCLEELKIKYEKGFPDEDVLVSFGPEFLSRLPNIRVFHLYRPDDDYDYDLQFHGIHADLSRFASRVRDRSYRRTVKKPKPTVTPRAPRRPDFQWIDLADEFDANAPPPPSHYHHSTPSSLPGPSSTSHNSLALLMASTNINTNQSLLTPPPPPPPPPLPPLVPQLHSHPSTSQLPLTHHSRSRPRPRRACTCSLRSILRPKLPARSTPEIGPCGLPDAHEYMASWEKYAPGLREVRLVDAFVWRRAGVGDDWCRRDLKPSLEDDEEEGEESKDDEGLNGWCTCNLNALSRSFSSMDDDLIMDDFQPF